jgi:hypothetical protein
MPKAANGKYGGTLLIAALGHLSPIAYGLMARNDAVHCRRNHPLGGGRADVRKAGAPGS